MKINTREHTIVEPSSTKGDVCFRKRFFSILEQKKTKKKKQNIDNEHTDDHQIYKYVGCVLIKDNDFIH